MFDKIVVLTFAEMLLKKKLCAISPLLQSREDFRFYERARKSSFASLLTQEGTCRRGKLAGFHNLLGKQQPPTTSLPRVGIKEDRV